MSYFPPIPSGINILSGSEEFNIVIPNSLKIQNLWILIIKPDICILMSDFRNLSSLYSDWGSNYSKFHKVFW